MRWQQIMGSENYDTGIPGYLPVSLGGKRMTIVWRKLILMTMLVLALIILSACSSTSTFTISTSFTDESGVTTTNTVTTQVDTSAGADGIKRTTNETRTTTTTNETETAEAGSENIGIEDGQDTDISEVEWEILDEAMHSMFNNGAEGTNEAGDMFYFAFSDSEDANDALLVIVSADGTEYLGHEGKLSLAEDYVVLKSDDMDYDILFKYGEADEEDAFTMIFLQENDVQFRLTFMQEGDIAFMHFVDVDTVISDIIARTKQY